LLAPLPRLRSAHSTWRAPAPGLIAAGTIERWTLLADIRLAPELPKTCVGKLNKRALRAYLGSA